MAVSYRFAPRCHNGHGMAGTRPDKPNHDVGVACHDAPGIGRGQIHGMIGDAALRFFGASLTGRAE